MAKLSRQTKETIKTIVVLIIVGLLLTTYAIYPLNNSDTLFARPDIETNNIDSLPPNQMEPFSDSGWIVDTFRVEPDALTSLACLSIKTSATDSVQGTVILIPSSDTTRSSQLQLTAELIKNSYNCFTYDQRASGLSSGKYHGLASVEAIDLQEIISYLDIHSQITQPLYIVGTGIGADAAILCAKDESRIKKIIAIEPFLTTDNIILSAKDKHGSIWFPLYKSVIFWWYKMNSGYAPTYITVENISALQCQTMLLTNIQNEAVKTIEQLSEKSLLTLQKYNNEELNDLILRYIHK